MIPILRVKMLGVDYIMLHGKKREITGAVQAFLVNQLIKTGHGKLTPCVGGLRK